MAIEYRNTKEFGKAELRDLFLSVGWSSGQYPEKLVLAMKGFKTVFSAWDKGRLVGMICVMDDGIMTAYVHYLLVNPEYQKRNIGKTLVDMVKEKYADYLRLSLIAYESGIRFYENCGFKKADGESPMFITNLTD